MATILTTTAFVSVSEIFCPNMHVNFFFYFVLVRGKKKKGNEVKVWWLFLFRNIFVIFRSVVLFRTSLHFAFTYFNMRTRNGWMRKSAPTMHTNTEYQNYILFIFDIFISISVHPEIQCFFSLLFVHAFNCSKWILYCIQISYALSPGACFSLALRSIWLFFLPRNCINKICCENEWKWDIFICFKAVPHPS